MLLPSATVGVFTLLLVQDGGLLLVATTRENVSPSVVLELLQRIGGIIKVPQSMPLAVFRPERRDE